MRQALELGALAAEIRSRLGPPPTLPDWPLVSIVVLNRDGAPHLRRLLAGLVEHTDYPRLELIVVDNGSSDESVDFLRRVEAPFAISIIANHHNESFSDANNQGAELASGELLLLLNNDIEPFERGWLRELVACYRRRDAGAVAATLLHRDPDEPASAYRVQVGPVSFHERDGTLVIERQTGLELFDDSFGHDVETPTVLGACLLIERRLFDQVGGLTHGYLYGGEDGDLCLKLRESGRDVLYDRRSFVVHHANSTTRAMHDQARHIIQANRRMLESRWGRRVRRELRIDLDIRTGLWAAPDATRQPDTPSRGQALALEFCLIADDTGTARDRSLAALEAELARHGHRCVALRDAAVDDIRGAYCDVAVYLRGPVRYIPRAGQLSVLWDIGGLDELTAIECRRYDLAVTDDTERAARLGAQANPTPVLALDPADPASSLVVAALRRAEELELPTRIAPA